MTTNNPSSQNSVRTAMILIVLAYILIYLLPLGMRPLATPDETRYGEIPREMIQSGNWAVPHLVSLRYFEKPPLGYWLNAISIAVFGENNFAIRFPTALSTGLSAWFIWLLLARLGYPQRTALSAAVVYLGMVEVLVVGNIAVLDSPFSLFLTAGMVLFYLGVNVQEMPRRRGYLLASGISFGFAFLTKGFLALVLPGMVLFVYALLQKRYRLLWTSVLVALIGVLTILPWGIIVHLREADFWHYFFWQEHIRRFLEPNAQHPEPMYFFVMYLPVMMFPWLAYVPAAIVGLRQASIAKDLLRYLLLWCILPFVFFSISRGKLTTYILPIFAPAAILIAGGVHAYLQSNKSRLFRLGAILNTLLLLIVLVFVSYMQYFNKNHTLFTSSESQQMIIMILCIVLTTVLCAVPIWLRTAGQRIALISVTILPLFLYINIVLPHTSLLAGRSPMALIEQVKPKITSNTLLVTDANVVRAVAWGLKRTDISLLQKGELTYGLSYPDAKGRFIGIEGLRTLLRRQDSGELKRPIAIFCESPCEPGLRELLQQYGAQSFSNRNFDIWLSPGKPTR